MGLSCRALAVTHCRARVRRCGRSAAMWTREPGAKARRSMARIVIPQANWPQRLESALSGIKDGDTLGEGTVTELACFVALFEPKRPEVQRVRAA